MSTTTENNYVSNGSTVLYSFTFPYINEADVKVSLNQLPTTAFTLTNATTVELDTAPAIGVSIRIYRSTPTDSVSSVFFPGSAIRAQDLNDNFEQAIYVVQESKTIIDNSDAASVVGIANEALNVANQANNTANAIDATAQEALSTANEADVTADQAIENAAIAQNTALSAKTVADNAIGVDESLGASSNQVLVWNGSAWTPGDQTGDDADYVSIKDYGAVGDFSASAVSAIEAAIASGAKNIAIPAGIYKIDSTITTNGEEGIRIFGVGSSSVLKLANGYNENADRLFFNLDDDHNNWRFESFVIDGNASNMGSDECRRDKLIKMKGQNVFFSGIIIRDEAGRGGVTWVGDNQSYVDCKFINIGSLALDSSVLHPGQGANPVSNVIVSNCIFDTPDAIDGGYYQLTGIDAIIQDNCTVTGCTINGGNKGIIFSWGEYDSNNITITGNSIRSGKAQGIHFYKTDSGDSSNAIEDIVISGNILKGASGITLNGGQLTTTDTSFRGIKNVSVSGNVIENRFAGGNGLAVSFSETVNINGNTIHQCTAENGLDLRYVTNAVVNGNNVDDNSNRGIACTQGKNIQITGNNCTKNGKSGIYLDNTDRATISSNVCNNNSQLTVGAYDGIKTSGSVSNIDISGNTCFNEAGSTITQGWGINIGSNSNVTSIQITNNNCSNNINNGQITTASVSAAFDYIRLGNVGRDRSGNGGVDDSRAANPTSNNYIGKIYLHRNGSSSGPVYRYYTGSNTWVDM